MYISIVTPNANHNTAMQSFDRQRATGYLAFLCDELLQHRHVCLRIRKVRPARSNQAPAPRPDWSRGTLGDDPCIEHHDDRINYVSEAASEAYVYSQTTIRRCVTACTYTCMYVCTGPRLVLNEPACFSLLRSRLSCQPFARRSILKPARQRLFLAVLYASIFILAGDVVGLTQ